MIWLSVTGYRRSGTSVGGDAELERVSAAVADTPPGNLQPKAMGSTRNPTRVYKPTPRVGANVRTPPAISRST